MLTQLGEGRAVKHDCVVGCRGEAGGPCDDSIMLATKRLIRIECSIDVKPPFAPAVGTLITGFPL